MRVFVLLLSLVVASAHAELKTITITPATSRDDGTPLPLSEIASHLIECSTNGQPFEELERLEMPTVQKAYDFGRGTHVCRVSTIDTFGLMSLEALETVPFEIVPANPNPPIAVDIS